MEYKDIYNLRLNRYGLNYQSRIQGEREHLFDLYLMKSTYRVNFTYNGVEHPGSFEKYKQDTTETLHYLLTHINLDIPNGTVLMLPDKDHIERPWMVYYLESIKASGYNRYIMLKMTNEISFMAPDGSEHTFYAYLHGKGDTTLQDTEEHPSTLYFEDENKFYLITPKNEYIKKELYFEVGEEPFKEHFRVLGYDIWSTPGVEYVTLDPTYEYDLTPAPEKEEGDKDEDYFWFNGVKGDDDNGT